MPVWLIWALWLLSKISVIVDILKQIWDLIKDSPKSVHEEVGGEVFCVIRECKHDKGKLRERLEKIRDKLKERS